ncbi:MAG: LysR family transcriptional regulator [Kofleriaceae bacterium]|nr:LysR family transcriptional regulator [Kofleriaceae bacterium]MBP9169851.1 LysR family transcriptional regulator [Kofleriaceae bacterium]
MELRELGYFVAVFEAGTISAAARRCHISQPSVSTALAVLEADLGAALFVRHARGVTPTAAAVALYPTARHLLAEAAAVRARVRAPVPVAAELTIAVTRSLDAVRLRDVLAAAADARDLRLRVVDAEARAELRVVTRGQLRRGENFRRLWRERFVVALPVAHPLAARASLRAGELLGQPFIERCHCEHARAFARRAPAVEPAARATSEEWALALVAAGIGFAVVPAGVVRDDPRIAVRPLIDVAVEREVGLAVAARPTPLVLAAVARIAGRFVPAAVRASPGRARPPTRAAAGAAR